MKKGGWISLFCLALLIHFLCSLAGWNHSLLEHHSYRQSQTAITVQGMVYEGAWLNYLTPVLGPPWQVPLEFPLYQMIVAGICLLLHTPIDQTGRAVSLFLFYASFWPMNLFLRHLVPERDMRFMILSLVLFAPVYIYFSRCVMIESTAWFLGFCFLLATVRQILKPTLLGWGLMLGSGTLCALVKITTFCAFCFPCVIIPLMQFLGESDKTGARNFLLRSFGILIPAYLVPIGFGLWWAHRSDLIKLASPATEKLTTAGLATWNFGSLSQRLDPQSWLDLSVRVSLGLTFLPLLAIILTAVFVIGKRDRCLVALFLVSFVLPLMVFFNLYVVHDYYFYASSIFLIFALGHIFSALIRQGSKWGKLLWVATIVSFIAMYSSFLFPKQWKEDKAMVEVVQAIRENSQNGDYLLIYGEIWDSRIPYHSGRRAFMNYYSDQEDIEKFDETLDRIKGWKHIRLAVINSNTLARYPYFGKRLASLGFPENPDRVIHGFLLFRKQDVPGQP